MSSISQEMRRDAQKSPSDLEHEIDVTRAELEDTLEELEHRLNPNELFNQAMTRVRQHGGEFTHNLGDSIKQNPLPTLLTSIGIAWLMAMNGRSDGHGTTSDLRGGMHDRASGLRRGMHETRDALRRGRERVSSAKDRAASALHRGEESIREGIDSSRSTLSRSAEALRSGTHSAADSARGIGARARGVSSRARGGARRARAGAEHLLADQPLLLGALGIAAGALLGAALPASEQEDRALGRLRDDALDHARALGAKGVRRAREKAEQVAEQGREALAGNGHGRSNEMREGELRPDGSAERSSSSYREAERTSSYASERGDATPSSPSLSGSGLSASSAAGASSSEWPNPTEPERNEDLRIDTPKAPRS